MIQQRASLRLSLVAAVLAVAVAGCGGGGGHSTLGSVIPTSGGGTSNTSSAVWGNVTFTIPAAGGSTVTTSATKRLPLVLSPGGNAICVTVKNLDPATSGIYGSGYAGSAFTSCQAYNPTVGGTITVPAPPGNDIFSIGEYIVPNASTALPFTSNSTTSFPAGAQLLSGVAPPTSNAPNIGTLGTNTITTTAAVTASAAAQTVTVSSTASIVVGSRLNVDPALATQEFVTVTAVTANSITAIFTQNHASGATINGVVTLPAGQSVSINALLNPAVPTTPITLVGAAVAQLGFAEPLSSATAPPSATLSPVAAVREQGAFLVAGRKIAIPIPITAYDKSNVPIPTVESVRNGTLTDGALPAGTSVTITRTENAGPANPPAVSHSSIVVIDALTNAIVPNTLGSVGSVTLTTINSLNQTDFPTIAATQINDPMVLAVLYDGSSSEILRSITVTMTTAGTGAPALVNNTFTIQPQSMIYSAGNYIVPDTQPVSPVALSYIPTATVPGPAAGLYMTDGNALKVDGVGGKVLAAANPSATLTGMWYNDATNLNTTNRYFYATDASANGVVTTPSSTAGYSGIYAFDPTLTSSYGVAVQRDTSDFMAFGKPVGVVKGPDQYLYVADASNGAIYKLAVFGANMTVPLVPCGAAMCQEAQLVYTYPAASFKPGSATYLGLAADPSTGTNIYVPSPGDNTIKAVNVYTGAVSTFATGAPFIAATADTSVSATSPTFYATTTNGTIWTFPSTGGAATNTGLSATGATTDGFAGVLGSPTSGVTAPPAPYLVQGQTGNFFNATPPSPLPTPYGIIQGIFATLIPGAIFNNAATVDTAIGALPDTLGTGTTAPPASSIKSGLGIAYIPATAAATNNLTPASFIFADGTSGTSVLRTLVP